MSATLLLLVVLIASNAIADTWPGGGQKVQCSSSEWRSNNAVAINNPPYTVGAAGYLSPGPTTVDNWTEFYRNGYRSIWWDRDAQIWKVVNTITAYEYGSCTVEAMPTDPPPSCDDERAALEESCGGYSYVDWENFDNDTCSGTCNCLNSYEYYASQCGGSEYVTAVDLETCTFMCSTCEDKQQELEENCPYGYIFDNINCTGRCRDCLDYSDECTASCRDHNGVQVEDCTFSPDTGFNATCVCRDAYTPPVLSESEDPGEKSTDVTPEPDPTLPDPDTSDPWSQSIKKNLDAVIGQNNETNSKLDNLAENTKRIVDNQAAQTEAITGKIGEGNELLEGIGEKLDELGEGESTDLEAPGQVEFDPSVGDSEDWTEYDDTATISQEMATTKQTALETLIAGSSNPITAAITASGSACLSGDVSLHGKSKALSICFDRPWMEQGYSIMRLVLMGIGYLQVALMINRALASS